MKYGISIYSDGIQSKYGNERDLDIVKAVDGLMYYDDISNKYSSDELEKILSNMKRGDYRLFGDRWSQIKISVY